MRWWVPPLVRLIAAVALPLVVPAVITVALWVLPGDPAEIICPPGICDGTEALAARWGLDRGPFAFYIGWMTRAALGDFGASWRVAQGTPVGGLLVESVPHTAALVTLATCALLLAGVLAAVGALPRRADPLLQGLGLLPAVILALVCAAWVEIHHGALSHEGWPGLLRLLLGAGVLAVSDGALAGAVIGTRSAFDAEMKQRYIQVALLRGETALSNALPNVSPALVGQLRARALHVTSGAVVVEVILGVPGLGELLWEGTLLQDFGVVLAAAFAFSLLSAALLVVQAAAEIGVALFVRRHPGGVAGGAREGEARGAAA